MAGVIRVAIVDDHPVAAAGVAAALADAPDMEIVAVAANLESAVDAIAAHSPDVVLCDVQLGRERGFELPARLADPAPAVMIFTSFDYPSYVRAAVEAGAAGFVLKTASLSDIVAAIRTVAAGGTAYSARDLRAARTAPRMPSARELQVVSLVAAGRSNSEIGAALEIDERTVESHLRRLFTRYSVDSRTELATFSVRNGWIDPANGPIDLVTDH